MFLSSLSIKRPVMVSMGLLGLFIGAIVLGLGYKFFQVWLAGNQAPDAPAEAEFGA